MQCRHVVYINNAERISLEEEAWLMSTFKPCRLTTVIKNSAVTAEKSIDGDFKIYRRECGGRLSLLLKVIKECSPAGVVVFKESEISVPFFAFILLWFLKGGFPEVYYFATGQTTQVKKLSFIQVFCCGKLIAKPFKDFAGQQFPKLFAIPDNILARFITLLIPGKNANKCSGKRLLIDCSDIYKSRLATGIQRVVRNVLKYAGSYAAGKSMTVIPVALENGQFIAIDINFNKLKGKIAWLLPRSVLSWDIARHGIAINKTDTLLMLDASHHLNVWPSLDNFKRQGGRIIGVVYDLIPVSHPEFFTESHARIFKDWLAKSLDYYDGYICISRTVMNNLHEYVIASGRDVARYEFDYFRLGADFGGSKTVNPANVRSELQAMFAKNKSVYIAVSTIEPRKNHLFLINTFDRLWEKDSDAALCIIGKIGWKVESLINTIATHARYGNKLFMWNDLSDDELVYCYRNAGMSLFPSFIEGFGLPIIESVNNGLPVLASDIPIHREVGQDMIEYFNLNSVDELVEKITKIESGESSEKKQPGKLPIVNWEESARTLIDKVLKMGKVNL